MLGLRPTCIAASVGFFSVRVCTMKQLKCSCCREIKDETEFTLDQANPHRGNKSYRCRKCEHAHHKEYLNENPHIRDKINANKRKYYKTSEFQEKQRRRCYKLRYGITLEMYNEMLEAQNGVCAICGRDYNHKRHKHFHVDHNHKTSKVRGLLCIRCNTLVGNSGESVEILKKAIDYINRYLDKT